MIKRTLTVVFFSAYTFLYGQETKRTDTLRIDNLLNLSFEDLMNVSVVTATLSTQKSNEVPATVVVITREQIQIRGYQNLAAILQDLPDFTISDKSDPQYYNRVSARGVSRQDLFVILLDGIRISSPTNEPLPFLENFPIYLARQIEVVYGPGSALYGADAVGGVINIITQEPGDEVFSATVNGGTQGYRNVSAVFNKRVKQDDEELNVCFGGQYTYDAQPDFSKIYKNDFSLTPYQMGIFNTTLGMQNPRQAIRPKFEAPLRSYNFYASLEKGGLNMKVLHYYVAVPSSTGLNTDNGVFNKEVFYGQSVTTGSVSYNLEIGKFKSNSSLMTSYYSVNPKSNFRNSNVGMEHGYKYSTGSMMKAEEQVHYSLSRKLKLIGGVTYEIFQSVPKTPEMQAPVDTKRAASGILLNSISENRPSGIEAKFFMLNYFNVGSYLQAQYVPADKLSFTVGIRYDRNSRFGSTINPRIGSVFQLSGNTTLKALYGTSYWAPSPLVSFETYGSFYTTDSGDTYQSFYWHLPNPNLKPITSKSFELSLQQRIGQKFSVTLTAYKTTLHDLIKNVADNGNTNLYNNQFLGWDVTYIEVPFNEGLQKDFGGNVSINGTFRIADIHLHGYSSLSYLDGRELANSAAQEVEQGGFSPLQLRAGLDAEFRSFHFSVRVLNAGKQRTARFSDNKITRQTIDGYVLVNLSVGHTWKKKSTVFVNVQNLLDERYKTPLSWDPVTHNGSFQNPIRATLGVRVGL